MTKKIKVICIALSVVIILCFVLFQKQRSRSLPVLMYHHFVDEVTADTCVTPETFKEQLTALKNAGFTTVTIEQVLNYVKWGIPLPENPVLITMDDGYTSNITLAAPILEELDMCATVFVIGYYEGKVTNSRTGRTIYPERFSYEAASEWVEKGVLDLQCHSFDMHQLASDGFSGRDGMLPLENEDLESYKDALHEDIRQFRQRRDGRVSTPLTALAFPYGYYSPELDGILREEGIQITFTIEEHCSEIRVWDFDSLRMLGRYNITERWNPDDMVTFLQEVSRII